MEPTSSNGSTIMTVCFIILAVGSILMCLAELLLTNQSRNKIAKSYAPWFLLLGLVSAAVTVLARTARYGIETLSGHNYAATPHYHGPARIVGYQPVDQESNDDDINVINSATMMVAYGGSWACPSNPDLYCEVETIASELVSMVRCKRYLDE
jgi:hypothetical protein